MATKKMNRNFADEEVQMAYAGNQRNSNKPQDHLTPTRLAGMQSSGDTAGAELAQPPWGASQG